jgi:DEAD/DEAH box helicase domain-containing protein
MNPALDLLANLGSTSIADRIDLEARSERRRALPEAYATGPIANWLGATLGQGVQPWNHQSRAFELIEQGHDVVISTATASGKSLTFQAPIVHRLQDGGRALVFYPTKALAADQRVRWDQLAERAGWPPSAIAEIHGDINPGERLEAIESAKVVIATPDVVHAWMMRQLSTPTIQAFLADLRLLVIDEAHVCEAIFGTNCAYFFRRLQAAHHRLRKQHRKGSATRTPPLQIIATTATIADPTDHLERLTGRRFASVSEEDDGSPAQPRSILHIDGPDTGRAAEAMLAEMLTQLAAQVAPNAFIAFHDSRQGVERIARLVDRDDVLPYRSGFEAVDRARIEHALRVGQLRGVVATSALELGIDIPQFTIGLNLAVPHSKKAFRQRIGRIGRASPGVFAIVAPQSAFKQFGSTLREYYESSVEPSYLYLDNRFIQFAQARCLVDECDALDGKAQLPKDVEWPGSFAHIFELAGPGSPRPREFDAIAEVGADRPHLNYPLRQICETDYALRDTGGSAGDRIGTIRLQQAIREAYPGATYLHLRQPKKVAGWRTSSYERLIRLEPARHAQPTTPLLTKTVNVSTAPGDLIEGRIRAGAKGLIAETTLQVNEAVEGYRVGATTFLYRELRKTNPSMTRKQRDFSTTGVVIRIDEPWFSGTGEGPLRTRQAVARALKQLLARERSIALPDVDFADSNIAIYETGGPRKTSDSIVIYDGVYGGLRLTEALFTHFEEFLERLVRAAESTGTDALVSRETAARLLQWHRDLDGSPMPPTAPATAAMSPGEYLIYAPQSEVGVRIRGQLVERMLLKPQLMPLQGTDLLMYCYEASPGVQGWIAHDQVEAVGQNWRQAIWTPETNVIRDLAA